MSVPVSYNRAVNRQQTFPFQLQIRDKDTGDFIDISTWEFDFTLKNKLGVQFWHIPNIDFARPDIYTIRFSRSVAQVAEVPVGNYVISLLVTNDDVINDEYMDGIWSFTNS